MNKNEVLMRLNKVFREVFDNENLEITDQTTSKDIAGWDSLMHITLMSEISDEFDIEFEMDDVTNLKSVGEMIEKIIQIVK